MIFIVLFFRVNSQGGKELNDLFKDYDFQNIFLNNFSGFFLDEFYL